MDSATCSNRRTVLAGAGAGVVAALTAGCSGGSPGSTSAAPSTSSDGGASNGSALPSGRPLAKLSDISVGSAVSAESPDGKPIVIAQPHAGEAMAFSAVCTHMGCIVAPAGKQLNCPCHGSVYDASTGQVLNGPAPRALPPYPVHIAGGEVLSGGA